MAKRQVEHYVVQLEPGSLFSEEYTHRVNERDPKEVDIRQHAFAFYFVDKTWLKAFDEDGNEHQADVKWENKSGAYFIDPKAVFSYEELKAWVGQQEDPSRHDILLSNCRMDGDVVHCRTGNWQQFDEGDQIWRIS